MEKGHTFVSSRSSKERAEKLAKHLENSKMVFAKVVPKKNGSTTVYEVWAKPTLVGKIYVGKVGSKTFASYIRVAQYGSDGEVI